MLALYPPTPHSDVACRDGFAWTHGARVAFVRWRRRRKAIAALHALSNRSLADIGIERSEIEAVVMAHSRDACRRIR